MPRSSPAFEAGHAARYAGKPAWHNPHLARSDEYGDWDTGWRAAEYVLGPGEVN